MVLLNGVYWNKHEGERSMMGLKESLFQIGGITVLIQLQVWKV